jgi:hypothetical protein
MKTMTPSEKEFIELKCIDAKIHELNKIIDDCKKKINHLNNDYSYHHVKFVELQEMERK